MFTKVFLEEFTINPPAFYGQSALAENQDGHLEAFETLGINSREPYTGINTKIKGNFRCRHPSKRQQRSKDPTNSTDQNKLHPLITMTCLPLVDPQDYGFRSYAICIPFYLCYSAKSVDKMIGWKFVHMISEISRVRAPRRIWTKYRSKTFH